MEYWKIVFERLWSELDATYKRIFTIAMIPFAAIIAYLGLQEGSKQTAVFIGAALLIVIVIFRLATIQPQIWREQQKKIEAERQKSVDEPEGLQVLRRAISNLLSNTRTIAERWTGTTEDEINRRLRDYDTTRSRCLRLADNYLNNDAIFRATQDAVNRCDIVISDLKEDGTPGINSMQEAIERVRNLQNTIDDETAPIIVA